MRPERSPVSATPPRSVTRPGWCSHPAARARRSRGCSATSRTASRRRGGCSRHATSSSPGSRAPWSPIPVWRLAPGGTPSPATRSATRRCGRGSPRSYRPCGSSPIADTPWSAALALAAEHNGRGGRGRPRVRGARHRRRAGTSHGLVGHDRQRLGAAPRTGCGVAERRAGVAHRRRVPRGGRTGGGGIGVRLARRAHRPLGRRAVERRGHRRAGRRRRRRPPLAGRGTRTALAGRRHRRVHRLAAPPLARRARPGAGRGHRVRRDAVPGAARPRRHRARPHGRRGGESDLAGDPRRRERTDRRRTPSPRSRVRRRASARRGRAAGETTELDAWNPVASRTSPEPDPTRAYARARPDADRRVAALLGDAFASEESP